MIGSSEINQRPVICGAAPYRVLVLTVVSEVLDTKDALGQNPSALDDDTPPGVLPVGPT